jgi:hypothetical protein
MSYIVNYTETKEERMTAAIKDAHFYLGDKLFVKVVNLLRENSLRVVLKHYRITLSFVGLEGAPARAMVIYAFRHKGHYMTNALLKN